MIIKADVDVYNASLTFSGFLQRPDREGEAFNTVESWVFFYVRVNRFRDREDVQVKGENEDFAALSFLRNLHK